MASFRVIHFIFHLISFWAILLFLERPIRLRSSQVFARAIRLRSVRIFIIFFCIFVRTYLQKSPPLR